MQIIQHKRESVSQTISLQVIQRNVADMNRLWNNAVKTAHEGDKIQITSLCKYAERQATEGNRLRRNFYAEIADMLRIIYQIRFEI